MSFKTKEIEKAIERFEEKVRKDECLEADG